MKITIEDNGKKWESIAESECKKCALNHEEGHLCTGVMCYICEQCNIAWREVPQEPVETPK